MSAAQVSNRQNVRRVAVFIGVLFLRWDLAELLLNWNIAARERAAGGVAVAQAEVECVRAPVSVIGHAHAVGNPGSIAQSRSATQVGAVSGEGKRANLRAADRDQRCRIIEG